MTTVRSIGPEVASPWRTPVTVDSSREPGARVGVDRVDIPSLSEMPAQGRVERPLESPSEPVSLPRAAAAALVAAATLCGPAAHAAAPALAPAPASTVAVALADAGRPAEEAPRLAFHPDGTFRIVQLTDIHFQPEEGSAYRERYDRLVGTILDAEKPDLVVITGDVLYWSGRPLDEYFAPALAPVVERGIPWAYTAGNHDEEAAYTGEDVLRNLQGRPYSLCDPGPQALGAGGNYVVEVQGRGGAPAALLYMMDSHDHHARPLDFSRDLGPQLEGTRARPDLKHLQEMVGPNALEAWRAIAGLDHDQMAKALRDGLELETASGLSLTVTRDMFVPVEMHGYDWLDSEQVRWYGDVSTRYTREGHGAPLPSLMFFHIPLPEYAALGEAPERLTGHRLEAESVQGRNTGLLSTIHDQGDVMAVFAGHDHLNDYVGLVDGVALGYGRKTGLSVYGPEPMARGGRVIELHEGQRRFDTWIRTEDGRVEDRITVPDAFAPATPVHPEGH